MYTNNYLFERKALIVSKTTTTTTEGTPEMRVRRLLKLLVKGRVSWKTQGV